MPPKRILAVDDEKNNLNLYEVLLGEDYEVELASSGKEALERAATFHPDVILLDVMMPGMNGFEVCQQLRADREHRYTKILLVSANTDLKYRLKGYEAGTDDYVTKPFDYDELMAKVSVFMRMKAAAEVDALKKNLLAMLCHETRTPLNGIRAPAEFLSEPEVIADEERINWATMIVESAENLERLFVKIQILNELREGKATIHCQPFDLVRSARSVLREVDPRAHARGVTVRLSTPAALLVPASENHLRFVLSSLVENAVRFAPENSDVLVELVQEDSGARLAVSDHGPGLAPSDLEHLFEDQGARSEEQLASSLPLCRAIVEAHGGLIRVESIPEKRTTFTVRLPGALRDEPAEPAGE